MSETFETFDSKGACTALSQGSHVKCFKPPVKSLRMSEITSDRLSLEELDSFIVYLKDNKDTVKGSGRNTGVNVEKLKRVAGQLGLPKNQSKSELVDNIIIKYDQSKALGTIIDQREEGHFHEILIFLTLHLRLISEGQEHFISSS